MKKFLLATLLLSAVSAHASPLDLIYDLPGSFWGRIDTSPSTEEHLTHVQFQVEQGLRFQHVKWLTFYASYTGYQQQQDSFTAKSNYYSYGVKNTTWIPHLTLGVEEQNYIMSTSVLEYHELVAYASAYFDWNLKRTE